jgi:hypothetical protein
MKYLKLHEEYINNIIPDDIAIWFMNFYSSQIIDFIKISDIPNHLFINSKKFIKNYFKTDILYRGESRNYEIVKPIKFSPENHAGISWCTDKDTAIAFIEMENKDYYNYLYEININNFKYPISMDYIMNNITEKQIKLITNPITKIQIENYVSECEVLIFDTFTSNDIKIKQY